MATIFTPNQVLGRGDLDIHLTNSSNQPTNAAEIYYTLYYVDNPGPSEQEVLLGPDRRVPINPAIGEYYAAMMIPQSATAGEYRIRWSFRQLVNSPFQQVVQEFSVVIPATVQVSDGFTPVERELINRLRILIRDSNPDRNYRFRPPEYEGDIGQYNSIFGQIWEDNELKEYMLQALDWFNSAPPLTRISSLDMLITSMPAWRAAVLEGAIWHACRALAINWVNEEFSVAPNTEVTVYTPEGNQYNVTMEELYEICKC